MMKWRGTPLDKLTEAELTLALEKTLEILREIWKENQRRADEIRRKAKQEMLFAGMREGSRIHKRDKQVVLPFARPVSSSGPATPQRGKRTKGETDGNGDGGGSGPRAA